MGKTYYGNITIVDNIFASTIAFTITNDNLNKKLKSIKMCWMLRLGEMQINNWGSWLAK